MRYLNESVVTCRATVFIPRPLPCTFDGHHGNVVNAFIDSGQGDNSAGVVLDAGGFSGETKQRIAARVGLSETAFVSPSSVADFKLEFFTPTRQIPHCGHATIATFCYLLQRGKITGHYNETSDNDRA